MAFSKPKGRVVTMDALAKECTARCQKPSKSSKASSSVDPTEHEMRNEINRLKDVGEDTLHIDSAFELSSMGRYLPAPGQRALCFYCRGVVTSSLDDLDRLVHKSKIFPSYFTVCCSECRRGIFSEGD